MEGIWWKRNIKNTKNKNRDRKTKKINKIEENKKVIGGSEIRIKLIKDTTKSETGRLRIKRINKL